jgi:hypothetical protein
MVWDTIDHPDGDRIERWGGIAYSLAAAVAALPEGWRIRPIIKVGQDLAASVDGFLDTLPGLEDRSAIVPVPHPNNRVHLHYRDRHHRRECLTGGVPPWAWAELEPRLAGLDALFVNLISGFELELDTARRLRSVCAGPLYADLHSLLLERHGHNPRRERTLDRADEWLASFDLVQVNETELRLVAGDADPWDVAARAVRAGLGAVLVTRGPAGATVVAAGPGPRPWDRPGETPTRWEVPVERLHSGDPTGCGDVWGATCFVALMRGEPLLEAAAQANEAASRKLAYRGADGLHTFLRRGP